MTTKGSQTIVLAKHVTWPRWHRQVTRQKVESQNGRNKKKKDAKFSKKGHFLPPDTHIYVCVLGGKNCLFLIKFDMLFSWFLRFPRSQNNEILINDFPIRMKVTKLICDGTLVKVNKLIRDGLRNLVSFVQFKKREKHPWRNVTFT